MDSETSSSMSFQKVVLVIAIVALILTLSFIGYMMYYAEQTRPYPPLDNISKCPDTWRFDDAAGNCKNTTSGQNIGDFIMEDRNCLKGSTACNDGLDTTDCSGNNWVQGNVSNNLDSTKCYLLAKGWKGSEILDISHNMTTLDADVAWAKKYGITWDGFN